jgi:bifunctional aspartokinase / homoserine dehydrogenase 1
MTSDRWWVHKFGGSSVANADCFRRVATIIEGEPGPRTAVVLSACRGVTDALLGLVAAAERREAATCRDALVALRQRHVEIADELLTPAARDAYVSQLEAELADIEGILHTVSLLRSAGQNVHDLIAGHGEIWSTRLFAAFLEARGNCNRCAGSMPAKCSRSSGGRSDRPYSGTPRAPIPPG